MRRLLASLVHDHVFSEQQNGCKQVRSRRLNTELVRTGISIARVFSSGSQPRFEFFSCKGEVSDKGRGLSLESVRVWPAWRVSRSTLFTAIRRVGISGFSHEAKNQFARKAIYLASTPCSDASVAGGSATARDCGVFFFEGGIQCLVLNSITPWIVHCGMVNTSTAYDRSELHPILDYEQ